MTSRNIMPNRRIGSRQLIAQAAEEAAIAARAYSSFLDHDDLATLRNFITEAAHNVFDHSRSSRADLQLAAQDDPPFIACTLNDRGATIPAAMRRNRSIAHETRDHLLLQTATNPGASSTGLAHRGRGLHDLLIRARRKGRTLEIHSGKARLTVGPDGAITAGPTPRFHSGTVIRLTIPLQAAAV